MTAESEMAQSRYNPFPPGESRRSMVIEATAEDLGSMLRRAFTAGPGRFTIYCDEPESIGGHGTAPAPLHYFAASILF